MRTPSSSASRSRNPARPGRVEHGPGQLVLRLRPGLHLGVGPVLEPAVGVRHLDAVQHVHHVVTPSPWPEGTPSPVVLILRRYRLPQQPISTHKQVGVVGRYGRRVAAPAWLDDLGFSPDGPPWLSMGLSRCAPEAWLWPDDQRDAELAERGRLLAEQHDEVFGARPGTEAAGAEVLALVTEWLAEQRPDLAVAPVRDDVHPLEAAGRLVQEDLCLMLERDGAPTWTRVACASRRTGGCWTSSAGRREVHGPVPRYDAELAERVDRYLTRLRPDVIGLRRNWTVHDSPALHSVRPPMDRPVTAADVPSALWLRSERQTLRRLPATGAVLFTIRVQQAPFGVLAESGPTAASLAARCGRSPTS